MIRSLVKATVSHLMHARNHLFGVIRYAILEEVRNGSSLIKAPTLLRPRLNGRGCLLCRNREKQEEKCFVSHKTFRTSGLSPENKKSLNSL